MSARNYAHEIFAYSEDLDETPENIKDELDDWLGEGRWSQVEAGVFEAVDTISAWPFIVRRRVEVVVKYHSGLNGWQEKPYDYTAAMLELMEPAVKPKVWVDCD